MAALAAASRYPGLNSILFCLWPKIKKKPPNYNTPYIRVNSLHKFESFTDQGVENRGQTSLLRNDVYGTIAGHHGISLLPSIFSQVEALLPFSPAMHASFQRVHPNFTISPTSIYLHQSSYTSTDPQLSLFRSIHVHSPLSTFIHLHQPTSTLRRPHRLRTASISEILRARNWIYVMQKPNFS